MMNTISAYFDYVMNMNPMATAIVGDGYTLSFRDLSTTADRIASLFPNPAPRRVGIVMNHGPHMIAAMLAVLRTGAAYVPVEPSFPAGRLSFIMNEADVDFVLTDRPVEAAASGKPLVEVRRMPAQAAPQPRGEVQPDDIAYILYTSGTTGKPKGVMIRNRGVCNYARAFRKEFAVGPGDVTMQQSVCTFDIFVEEVWASLLNGAAIAIAPAEAAGDVLKLLKFADRHHVTIISGFPYLIKDIDELGWVPASIRLLISGGDVLRASYIQNIKDKVVIYNTYGPSETTVCATYQRCDNIEPLADGAYPIGHPIEGVEVRVLNDELRSVAPGEMGEICIYGEGVGAGYLTERPESAHFMLDLDGRRMYRSGDVGYVLPSGDFAFVGRRDKQVMIEGKRVECEEVENVICECPEVDNAVVRPVTDGNGLSHMVAYIVPKSLKDFSLVSLKRSLSNMLAAFMIPEKFVKLAALPLKPSGKVDDLRLPVVVFAQHGGR